MTNLALVYANDVLSFKIPACIFVKQACKRFINDLAVFDFRLDKARDAVGFIKKFRHVKGEYAQHTTEYPDGRNFVLEPWQIFIVYNIFGFYLNDRRRFRKAYVEVPRKNGKTFLAAGIANYMMLADDEQGAEVYTAATKMEQAAICFDASYSMIEQFNREFDFDILQNNSFNNRRIIYGQNIYKPLSSEFKKLDGLNPHCSIIDEYHEHKSDGLYNVLMNGSGARTNPLLFAITTAGFNRDSACFRHREYCTGVLSGAFTDDRLFTVIYTMDKGDDWTDEKTWIKANPNYGISIYPEFLQGQLNEARESPTKKVEFLTKLLNVWTDSAETWIPDDVWMRNEEAVEYAGDCYGGLDLASVSDFCALTLAFPHLDGYNLLTRYYLCEDAVRLRTDEVGKSIRYWADQGYIVLTPGNVTDYDFIRDDIGKLSAQYNICSIAYDRYNSSQLVTDLINDGLTMSQFGQGYVSMSTPTKELERMCLGGKIWHGSNPVTRWQIGNVAIKRDPVGNIKITKEDPTKKVDGPVSIVMAIGEAMDALRNPAVTWNQSSTL